MPRMLRQAVGIAEDFWKDPDCEYSSIEIKLLGRVLKIPNILKPVPANGMPQAASTPVQNPVQAPALKAQWHALPGGVAERMWGEERILPAADTLLDMMVKPVGLARDKNVLDLTAGLGGTMRKIVSQVGQLKGYETDGAIAMRGMDLSVKAGKGKTAPIEMYDPAALSMPAIYHMVIVRELFYRVPDKDKFFYSISAGTKIQGHVVFTDYIVNPEDREKPGIVAWMAHEKDANPLTLTQMVDAWTKVGYEMKISEDQTGFYKHEIALGLKKFATSLANSAAPDAETKKGILSEVELWVRRLAALEQGMKFYRFDAIKS